MRTAMPTVQPRHQTDLAELLGATVVPGHYLRAAGGVVRCSCGNTACPAPGAHPLCDGWPEPRGSEPQGSEPGGRLSLLLPLGVGCDALDVPLRTGEVGLGYLRLWAVPLGPVLKRGARMLFLVQQEARDDLAGLMVRERLGDPRRGIRYRNDGYLPLPDEAPDEADVPVAGVADAGGVAGGGAGGGAGEGGFAGSAGVADGATTRWMLRPPSAWNRLPSAAELLGALAFAVHQLQRVADHRMPTAARR